MINCTFENGAKASLRHTVIDAIVEKDSQILLIKRSPQLVEGGKWAFVGGFVERNEVLKDTVAREVPEEAGYSVKNIRLFTIRDNPLRHEDRQNISIVFLCSADQKVGEHDEEVTDVKWFDLDKLPNEEEFAFDHFDIAQLYLNYRKENTKLPILDTLT